MYKWPEKERKENKSRRIKGWLNSQEIEKENLAWPSTYIYKMKIEQRWKKGKLGNYSKTLLSLYCRSTICETSGSILYKPWDVLMFMCLVKEMQTVSRMLRSVIPWLLNNSRDWLQLIGWSHSLLWMLMAFCWLSDLIAYLCWDNRLSSDLPDWPI